MSSVKLYNMPKRSKSKGDKTKTKTQCTEHITAAALKKKEQPQQSIDKTSVWEYGPFVAETSAVPHFVSESIQEIAAYWMNGIPKQLTPRELGYAKSCKVISDSRIVFIYENISDYQIGLGKHIFNAVHESETKPEIPRDLEISFFIQKPVFILGPFICYKQINRRCIECLRELIGFYSNSENILNLIVPIVNRTFDVSKRALEFCCVTKSKRDNVCYKYVIEGEPVLVAIHQQYNQWLKMWKRECFDFFQRYTRIYMPYIYQDEPKLVETTTGQLHGIYWAHMYGVIEYARKNLDIIMHDMSITHGRNRRDIKNHKAKGVRRPRQPLVDSSSKGLNMFPVDITVIFTEDDDYEDYSSDNGGSFQDSLQDHTVRDHKDYQNLPCFSECDMEFEIGDNEPMEIC